MLGVLAAVDVVWSVSIGLAINGAWRTAALVGGLLAVSVALRWFSRRLADIVENVALWIAFTAAGCVMTYLCATAAMPLQDMLLSRLDHAMGFDWQTWHDAVLGRPWLHWALDGAYASLLLQIVGTTVFLAALGRNDRCAELFLLAVLTFLPTALISALCAGRRGLE